MMNAGGALKRSIAERLLTFLLVLEYHLFIAGENIMRKDKEYLQAVIQAKENLAEQGQ